MAEMARIAKILGVSDSYVRHMVNEIKKIQPKHAPLIELATNGLVKREEIFPDLYKPLHQLKEENEKNNFPDNHNHHNN